jgi:hypothetical protein
MHLEAYICIVIQFIIDNHHFWSSVRVAYVHQGIFLISITFIRVYH